MLLLIFREQRLTRRGRQWPRSRGQQQCSQGRASSERDRDWAPVRWRVSDVSWFFHSRQTLLLVPVQRCFVVASQRTAGAQDTPLSHCLCLSCAFLSSAGGCGNRWVSMKRAANKGCSVPRCSRWEIIQIWINIRNLGKHSVVYAIFLEICIFLFADIRLSGSSCLLWMRSVSLLFAECEPLQRRKWCEADREEDTQETQDSQTQDTQDSQDSDRPRTESKQ